MEQEIPSRKPRRASQSVLDTLATEAASDQPTPEEVEGAPGAPAKGRRPAAAGAPPAALDRLIEQVRSSGVDAVFGKPQQVGEQTLIPVASITYGLGFGRGRGRQQPAEATEGEGEGGGGMVRLRPVGVIVVSQGNVEMRPVVDVNRLIFLAIVFVGTSMVVRALLGRR
jgi:uncharacterized spore protein YtfJ